MSGGDRHRAGYALVAWIVLGCAPELPPPGATTPAPAAPAPPAPPAPTPIAPPPETVSVPLPPPPSPPPTATATEKVAPAAPRPKPATTTPAAKRDALMEKILAGGGAALDAVLAAPETYRFQVLYTPVGTAGRGGSPALERHAYRLDAEYFFPASSMKVPIALASYERLASLRRAGRSAVTRDATIRMFSANGTSDPYVTTLARETWRALIVSDNFAANRMLGFVGHREVHETLWSLGLSSARIHTGFATGAEIDPAEVSPKIEVTNTAGGKDEIAARRSDLLIPPTNATSLSIGDAVILDGRRIPGPLSFADKNAMRLLDLQNTLVRIMRPELLPPVAGASAPAKDDLEYLRQALGTLPSASGLAGFERNVVADYQLSPFLRGIERVRPRGRFEIYSKVGQAFGFLIANAYVVDKDTGRAFFLTAAIYANPDGTMNDDKYAYETVSFPALASVGEAFARHAFAP